MDTSLDLTIERLSADGSGLAAWPGRDGKWLSVPGALPGERLRARLAEGQAGRAELLELLEASRQRRIDEYCPYLGRCGGCDFGHVVPEAQLELKAQPIIAALDRLRTACGAEPMPPVGLHQGPNLGYRNRAQFRAGPSGLPAYAAAASNQWLEVDACPVLVPALNDWLGSKPQPLPAGRFTVLALDGRPRLEGLDGDFSFSFMDRPLHLHPARFFQSNLGLLPALVAAVSDGVGGGSLADLYCGIGLFGALLRPRFERVHCVESDTAALAYTQRNVDQPAGFSAQPMDDWVLSRAAAQPFDYVVLDPPRAGLSPAVLDWLCARPRPLLGYVSCNPRSLLRDLRPLLSAGYRPERVELFDFYPNTHHLEAYVRLVRT